ncbi:TPA: hypothetical protein I7791_04710 [Vibrio vulnificus]|nr:hypothetical protein [Vibrio vulnificus]
MTRNKNRDNGASVFSFVLALLKAVTVLAITFIDQLRQIVYVYIYVKGSSHSFYESLNFIVF